MKACILFLMLTCQPRTAQVLTVASTALSVSDTWSTQRNLNTGRFYEKDLIAKPFQEHGASVAYGSTILGAYGLAWVASKMRTSRNWTRKVWWLPQMIVIGSGAYSTQHNIRINK